MSCLDFSLRKEDGLQSEKKTVDLEMQVIKEQFRSSESCKIATHKYNEINVVRMQPSAQKSFIFSAFKTKVNREVAPGLYQFSVSPCGSYPECSDQKTAQIGRISSEGLSFCHAVTVCAIHIALSVERRACGGAA